MSARLATVRQIRQARRSPADAISVSRATSAGTGRRATAPVPAARGGRLGLALSSNRAAAGDLARGGDLAWNRARSLGGNT